MQISNAYSQAAQTASYLAANRSDAINGETERASPMGAKSDDAPKKRPSADAVFAKYDLNDISPRDIDKMAAELRASDFDDVGFILGLETRGEKWRSHMMDSLNTAGYDFEPNFDPTASTDVIASIKEQINLSMRSGNSTEFLNEQLSKMEDRNAKAHPQTALEGASSQLAQTLVLFQAQRVWVE
ncbi:MULTISPECIES: hypothetical protein [Pacificibacter]|uniref:hypothetical protein n=1 Tax=Pacificibacter TaxID=1042323 RepID=UPI001C09AC75|nr:MULTISPECIES: hypothetical protein [Pacificibacter]MBU2934978.1 hypothetical protein [Pacificibacter marinus]MDO6616332.1 hypothetical protein [Pacificibacter sp. 1_MG-2023]